MSRSRRRDAGGGLRDACAPKTHRHGAFQSGVALRLPRRPKSPSRLRRVQLVSFSVRSVRPDQFKETLKHIVRSVREGQNQPGLAEDDFKFFRRRVFKFQLNPVAAGSCAP